MSADYVNVLIDSLLRKICDPSWALAEEKITIDGLTLKPPPDHLTKAHPGWWISNRSTYSNFLSPFLSMCMTVNTASIPSVIRNSGATVHMLDWSRKVKCSYALFWMRTSGSQDWLGLICNLSTLGQFLWTFYSLGTTRWMRFTKLLTDWLFLERMNKTFHPLTSGSILSIVKKKLSNLILYKNR